MKGKIFYIHWNPAEAESRAASLRKLGFTVAVEAEDGARACKHMSESPPDAVVINLSRLPSHGREMARALGAIKATREVPILFVGGTEEAVEKARAATPAAEFASQEEIELALARLTRSPRA
jgi:response regulator RpfG family c-di-GMP phosphodiesterase